MRTLVVNALRMSGQRTAIGRHIEYLAQQWSRMDLPFSKVILMSPGELHLDDLGTATEIELRSFGGRWPHLLWEQAILPNAAKGAAMLMTEYTCPLFYKGPMVVANHGIYEAIPQTFSSWARARATPLNRRSAQKACKVIANSLSTKSDLMEYFRIPESKIEVVYPGPADIFFAPQTDASINAEVVKAFGKKVPYVIFVGKLVQRRNIPNLIEAFSVIKKRENLPHHLLVVGPNVNNIPVEELADRFGIAYAFKHYPYQEQTALARLYAGADCYVLPSIYEGISWTMFEAMATGTAVLGVNHPALTEGASDAALSVQTPSVADLTRGMSQLLLDSSLRKKYEEKARIRVKKFSLFESARATMEVLDKAAPASDTSQRFMRRGVGAAHSNLYREGHNDELLER